MSLHAELTEEARAQLHAQRRNSTISALVIALLVVILIALLLGVFLLPNLTKDIPVIGFQHGFAMEKAWVTKSPGHLVMATGQWLASRRPNTLWVACAEWIAKAFSRSFGTTTEEVIYHPIDGERFDGRLDNDGSRAGAGGLANGLRVLDLTTVVAAPYCGVTLAQYGADVTRIAAPEPNHVDMIELTAGADVQRGKQNIVVDLTTDAGQQRLAELVAETDVVVCNMRPRAALKLNVDTDSIHALRPDALYCRISAFPESDWPGYDPLVQQASGVVEAYTRESRSGLGNWLGLAGSIDYGGGASGLFAIALGLIAQARGMSAGGSVEASRAPFAPLIQSDRIAPGTSLPPIPAAPLPPSLAGD